MKSKQSLYIPLVKGNRPAGEHTVEMMRQIMKGRRIVTINSDTTVDVGVVIPEVEIEAEAPIEVEKETPTWNSKTKKADLITIAEGLGLVIPEGATKADIIELLEG